MRRVLMESEKGPDGSEKGPDGSEKDPDGE